MFCLQLGTRTLEPVREAPLDEIDPKAQSQKQSDAQPLTTVEMIDNFIESVFREKGEKISKNAFNRVAGYEDRGQFEDWQKGKLRPDSRPAQNFARVLKYSPDEFLQILKKRKTLAGRK